METSFKTYPLPSAVRTLVCSDFDQTYLPFARKYRPHGGIAGLEDFITDHGEHLGMVMGLITGSSLRSVLRKAEGNMRFLPHFIAPSLGSELYWVCNGEITPCQEWADRIALSGFDRNEIDTVIDHLVGKGIFLQMQAEVFQGDYIGCYYLYGKGDQSQTIAAIKEIAGQHGMKAIISECNPAAGDPEDCYDVHLLPNCCGKGEVVDYLRRRLGIEHRNTWAFGDSMNDMEMLNAACNSFLVANADPEAKKQFPRISQGEYCHGIVEKLQSLLL